MNDLILYKSILIMSMVPTILVFLVLWQYEKDSVLKTWGISMVICIIGVLATTLTKYTYIADSIYFMGEIIGLIGCCRLMKQWTSYIKQFLVLQKYYVGLGSIFLFLVAVLEWPIRYFAIFIGIWYVIAAIVWLKLCACNRSNRLILSFTLVFHGIAIILFCFYRVCITLQVIINNMLSLSYILLGVAIVVIYYYRKIRALHESLSLTDEIMENLSVMLGKVDCKGNIIYHNKRIKDLLGYDECWVKMGQIVSYMHDRDRLQMRNIMTAIRESHKVEQFQVRLRHRKGYYIWVGLTVNPILDKQNNKLGNVVSCKEITTEKITYLDLQRNQRKFYQLFNGIQDAIFIATYSMDYTYTYFYQFNQAACKNFGYNEEECKSMSLADFDIRFLEHRDLNKQKEFNEILAREDKVMYETQYRTKSGQFIPVEVVHHKFKLNSRDMIMTVVRDISERNIIKETKKLEKLKSDFLANVAHELRTPLNVVIITLQSMEIYTEDLCGRLGEKNEKGKHYTSIMKQNALRLLKLVNNFLSMAKIEAGYYEANKQNYNIVSLVEDISQSVFSYIQENGITFEFDTNVEEKVVCCDPEMIEKIILNLISNAVKFTDPGGMLMVDIVDKEDKVQIIVTDSGRGIPENKLDVIFERFRQADKTFTRKQEGCGIGLSLVKSLVEAHEGTITVCSEVGIGSQFIVELPAFISEDVPYESYDLDEKGNTLYRRALEFSDIIHNEA